MQTETWLRLDTYDVRTACTLCACKAMYLRSGSVYPDRTCPCPLCGRVCELAEVGLTTWLRLHYPRWSDLPDELYFCWSCDLTPGSATAFTWSGFVETSASRIPARLSRIHPWSVTTDASPADYFEGNSLFRHAAYLFDCEQAGASVDMAGGVGGFWDIEVRHSDASLLVVMRH